jgi:hypothetical protein
MTPVWMPIIRVAVRSPIVTRRIVPRAVKDRHRHRDGKVKAPARLRFRLAEKRNGNYHCQHNKKLFHTISISRRLPRFPVTLRKSHGRTLAKKIGSELATVEASSPRSSIHFDEPARSIIRACLRTDLSKWYYFNMACRNLVPLQGTSHYNA